MFYRESPEDTTEGKKPAWTEQMQVSLLTPLPRSSSIHWLHLVHLLQVSLFKTSPKRMWFCFVQYWGLNSASVSPFTT
jgi:hypothetical protein